MLGFINVYKPSGMTSNAVVQKIKKRFHIDKIGHMGTLDPLACGVLPIAIGKATRMFDYSLNKTKRYTAIFDFGYTTDTLDIDGEITQKCNSIPTENQIIDNCKKLLGEINQVPPIYSAKCINGERAYDLARRGESFSLNPKKVIIYKIDLVERISDFQFKFDIQCSSGTYIRAIARDLGILCDSLGCMSFLERTESGTFSINNSIHFNDIMNLDSIDDIMINPIDAFNYFDCYEIDDSILFDLINGKRIKFHIFSVPTFIVCKDKLIGVAKTDSDELILNTFLYE